MADAGGATTSQYTEDRPQQSKRIKIRTRLFNCIWRQRVQKSSIHHCTLRRSWLLFAWPVGANRRLHSLRIGRSGSMSVMAILQQVRSVAVSLRD
jgi:hypothetical protein